VNRRDLQALSRIRLAEARALLSLGHWDGAYYLAGYAVECALKACIAKETRRHEFPDRKRVESSHTHDLRGLVRVANLEDSFANRPKTDRAFEENWGTVQDWSEQSRYRRHSPEAARKFIKAVNDRYHGIVPWIKPRW
jgi:HEPN domain-containing protein